MKLRLRSPLVIHSLISMPKPNQELAETLTHVMPKQWRSTLILWQLHTLSSVGRTAISNRLQKLRALNLVMCRKAGKEKLWRRVK